MEVHFSSDVTGLPEARAPEVIELGDGDQVQLRPGPVLKRLGDATVRMLAYNASVPGPTLKVRQGTEVVVQVVNDTDTDTTVHWHGLRLENRFDGVPHETQRPIPPAGSFTYRLQFPDPGLYWYHPHVREDVTQELGLYGNVLVEPADPDYWPPADRDVVLTVDDVLLEGSTIAPFSRTETNYAAMGRYGNVMLTGGQTEPALAVRTGEVVRLWLTDTANTRVFRVAVPGARMKLIGGDSGRMERAELVDDVVLAPSERAVADVLFDRAGDFALEHRTPERTYRLASVTVTGESAEPSAARAFEELRRAPELVAEREQLETWLARPPDKVLAIVAEMAAPTAGHDMGHGMSGHGSDAGDGIEWEDQMVEMNRATTDATIRWMLLDRTDGRDAPPADWRFTAGERVKIRLVNEMNSHHPMHHPFHIHGAGRFLVIARDEMTEPNLVWKDTVLIRTGQTVDLLFDVTNPGLWMAHCHIAEHMHSGMMFSFTVARRTAS